MFAKSGSNCRVALVGSISEEILVSLHDLISRTMVKIVKLLRVGLV